MSKAKEIELIVLKYEKNFTKRTKDIKKNSWFSFPNDILLHPDFTEITGEELKWFLWIVSICSKINQSKIRLNIVQAKKFLSLNENDLFSMIEKLKGNQIDVVCDQTATERDQAATGLRRDVASTLHYTTLHNNTLQNITEHNTTLQNIVCSEPEFLVPNLPAISKRGVKKTKFKFSENLEIQVDDNLITSWADTFPKEYLDLEFKKSRSWILANTHKTPKKNWGNFLNNWLNRGWDQYRKTLTSNPQKVSIDDLNEILGGVL